MIFLIQNKLHKLLQFLNIYLDVGAMIAKAMDKVGKEGVITVEEAKGLITS